MENQTEKKYNRTTRGEGYGENRDRNPELFIQERLEQRLALLEKNPDALAYTFALPIKEKFLHLIRIIDAADATIREEWGYGITMEEIKEWDKVLNNVKMMADRITTTALKFGDEYLLFDFSEIKNQRLKDKIELIKNSAVPVDLLISNSNIALPLFEMIITVDKYDSLIRRHYNTDTVKKQWLDQLDAFAKLLKESNQKAYALIYKAKDGVIKSIRYVNLKKEIHEYREKKQRQEAIERNKAEK